jgi:hypothetical protein
MLWENVADVMAATHWSRLSFSYARHEGFRGLTF